MSVLELFGALFGIIGAALLASNTRWSRWGWVAFLASNRFLIGFALHIEAYALLAMQSVFTGTSLLGSYTWFVRSPR